MKIFKLLSSFRKLNTPTCIIKLNHTYFIVDCWNNRILYTKYLFLPLFFWKSLKGFNRPHKLIFYNNFYYVCDTDNNRVMKINHKLKKKQVVGKDFLFCRPHDIHLVNHKLYIVDSLKGGRIVCIDPIDNSFDVIIKFSSEYVRSLFFNSKKIFASSASSGLIYIFDLKSNDLVDIISNYSSKAKIYSMDLSLQRKVGVNRFVPNSIIFFSGSWYLSNYFFKGTRNRLIQFDNWLEFKKGKFKDLSHLVNGVPYFMTIIDNCLAVGEIDGDSSISMFKTDILGSLNLTKRIQ